MTQEPSTSKLYHPGAKKSSCTGATCCKTPCFACSRAFLCLFLGKDDTYMAKAKYSRQKNGYFQTKVWDGTYLANGKKHLVNLRSDKSSKDLELKVNEFKLRVRERDFVRQTDITVFEYAKAWRRAYKPLKEDKSNINTVAMYDNIIEKHFSGLICRWCDLNRAHIVYTLNNASGDRTRQQILMTLKQVVKSATKDKLVAKSLYDDLFDDINIKYKSKEKRPLTDYEKKAVTAADFLPKDRALVYLLYGCGLRREEALALTVFDFSLAKKEVSVNKAIAFDDNTPVLKDTKNHVHRMVPIPDSIFPFLESYIRSLRSTKLFQMSDGSYITKSSYDKTWARIIRTMQLASPEEINGLTAHIFRHNYCTSLCYKIPEISIAKIAELMGDTEKMVIEVYNHIIAEKEKPLDVVASALAL